MYFLIALERIACANASSFDRGPNKNTKSNLRAGLHYGGEGLRSVKNAWPRHGYMRQMVDVPEKN